MKHLRKSILTLLALTLFGGAGAWAQEETLLTTIENTGDNASFKSGSKTFDEIATVTFSVEVKNDNDNWGWYSHYESDNQTITVTAASDAYTITRVKFYTANGSAFDEEAPFEAIVRYEGAYIAKVNGTSIGMWGVKKIEVYGYEGSPEPAAIELTKAGANQWTLGQTPDYDLELQVEYYEAHALKDIPAGWQVKVNGVDKTADIDHDSLMITETDAVTLIPAGNPRRVKSVTLSDEVQPITFTVKRAYPGNTDGTYTVAAGTTWQQFLESGNAPACLSKSEKWILHDINHNLSECTGTNMVNTADNKYIRPGDAIIDGATYACDQYVGWQGHL